MFCQSLYEPHLKGTINFCKKSLYCRRNSIHPEFPYDLSTVKIFARGRYPLGVKKIFSYCTNKPSSSLFKIPLEARGRLLTNKTLPFKEHTNVYIDVEYT